MTITTHTAARRISSVGHTTIAEVMTRAPHAIERDQKLSLAFDVMREHDLRHLPVLERGRLVGVLSQRDLHRFSSVVGVEHRDDAVSRAMSGTFYSVAPGELVADVARTMGEERHGCAIVVDCGRVVGIFTATDALALLAKTISS